MTTLATPQQTPGVPSDVGTRSLLERRRASCVRQRKAALIGSPGDPVARARSAALLRTIERIDAALARLEAGTYGLCTRCGDAIDGRRLEFRPLAGACTTCRP